MILINVVTILIKATKMATQGLHKIKVFLSKGYNVIIFAYNTTNKILSRESNYVTHVITVW